MSEKTSKNPDLLSVKELYKNSWIIYRQKIKRAIYLSLFGLVPSFIIAVVIAIVAEVIGGQKNYVEIMAITSLILGLPLFYISLRVNIAIFLVISRDVQKVSEAWSSSKKYFWPYALTNFWLGLVLALWFMALIIPALIFAVFYSLSIWIFFMEGYYGFQALQRSKELITGYWWAIAWRLLVLFFPAMVVMTLISAIPSQDQRDLWGRFVDYFYSIFVFIFTLRLYKNLRRIKGPSAVKHKKYGILSYVLVIIGFVLLMMATYIALVLSPWGTK